MCSTPLALQGDSFPSLFRRADIQEAKGKLNEFQTVFEIDAWLLQFQIQPLRRLEILTLLLISLPGCPGGTGSAGKPVPAGQAGWWTLAACRLWLVQLLSDFWLWTNGHWPLSCSQRGDNHFLAPRGYPYGMLIPHRDGLGAGPKNCDCLDRPWLSSPTSLMLLGRPLNCFWVSASS